MMTVIETLEAYYEVLDSAHKAYRDKYKSENPRYNGFQYSREKQPTPEERKQMQNIKEQKLHIMRLLKLMDEGE